MNIPFPDAEPSPINGRRWTACATRLPPDRMRIDFRLADGRTELGGIYFAKLRVWKRADGTIVYGNVRLWRRQLNAEQNHNAE